MLEDIKVIYILGDNGASAEGLHGNLPQIERVNSFRHFASALDIGHQMGKSQVNAVQGLKFTEVGFGNILWLLQVASIDNACTAQYIYLVKTQTPNPRGISTA